jgi:hypothetical protein
MQGAAVAQTEPDLGTAPAWPALRTGLALRAPGTLRSRMVVLAALIATPWLTATVHIDAAVRCTAGGLLVLHLWGAWYVRHRADPLRGGVVAFAQMVADAVGCGVLIGAGDSLWGAGTPLAAVVLVIAFETARAPGMLAAAVVMLAVTAVTYWVNPGSPLILSPQPTFETTLGVDTTFGGAPAVDAVAKGLPTVLDPDPTFGGARVSPAGITFPTTLAVDTSFNGVSALAVPHGVFVFALGLALLSICVGSGASLISAAARPVGQPRPSTSHR